MQKSSKNGSENGLQLHRILEALKNTYFSDWFYKHKSRFELYDVTVDYFETNNLINNPKYEQIYKTLKYYLFEWIKNSDFGNMNESAMLELMFSRSISIPKLNTPKIVASNSGYIVESNNPNTSVGWRNENEIVWNIYTENKIIPTEHMRNAVSPQISIPNDLLEEKYPNSHSFTYGLGWFTNSYREEFQIVHHGGGISGFTSAVRFFPDEEIGIVVLCNQDLSSLPELVATLITDKLLGVETNVFVQSQIK